MKAKMMYVNFSFLNEIANLYIDFHLLLFIW